MHERTIKSVFKEYKSSLLAIAGVVGVAIGESNGKACIRVFVYRKDNKLLRQIPHSLEDYEVIVEKTGEIRALNTEKH
ncbi:hypothetical protein ACFLVY_02610 [Chloroflexota bacterium]